MYVRPWSWLGRPSRRWKEDYSRIQLLWVHWKYPGFKLEDVLRPFQVISDGLGGLVSGEIQQSSIPISVESWSRFIRRRRAGQPCSDLL